MKKTKSYTLTLLMITALFLLSPGCHSNQKLVSNGIMFSSVKFGESGGFTNLTESYLIESDGGVYKMNMNAVMQLGTLEDEKIMQIEADLRELCFEELELEEVGNMTYFIEVTRHDSVYNATWTDATKAPDVKTFYKDLTALIKF